MSITRREFTMALAALLACKRSHAQTKNKSIVLAPSNLGLRPLEEGHEPGAWRAPQVLMDAGLARAINATEIISLDRPKYEFEAQTGTRIRNGNSIRAFSLKLS